MILGVFGAGHLFSNDNNSTSTQPEGKFHQVYLIINHGKDYSYFVLQCF